MCITVSDTGSAALLEHVVKVLIDQRKPNRNKKHLLLTFRKNYFFATSPSTVQIQNVQKNPIFSLSFQWVLIPCLSLWVILRLFANTTEQTICSAPAYLFIFLHTFEGERSFLSFLYKVVVYLASHVHLCDRHQDTFFVCRLYKEKEHKE